MGDLSTVGGQSNSDMIDLTGKITVVAVIMVFLVIVFVFLLHVYAKWFWHRLEESSSNSNPAAPRRRFDFASNQELAALRKDYHAEEAENNLSRKRKLNTLINDDDKVVKVELSEAAEKCDVSTGEWIPNPEALYYTNSRLGDSRASKLYEIWTARFGVHEIGGGNRMK